ncbi:hypothetical protein [Salmonella enterica]|uniref:hypothetical protein n=1 Tax=Salmonella enterica TaxID=28901 RepID=UPI000DED1380|nr:hypothetical protein [Salmonella enterica]AXD41516.1 hypothetical protein CHD70_03830 [Salmonella enterica]
MASNKNFQLAFEIGGKVAASLPKSFNVAHQAVAKLNSELTDLRKTGRGSKASGDESQGRADGA